MKGYCLDKLIKIKVYNEDYQDSLYHLFHQKEDLKYWFGGIKRKAGIYRSKVLSIDSIGLVKTLPNHLRLNSKFHTGICVKPRVELLFIDDYSHTKYFETYREACEYAKKIEKDVNCKILWIK
ncbi:MAG: hypothetical protein ACOWWH_12595 [Eubacteriaceae bacterium]